MSYEALTEARLASFLAEQVPHVWAKLGAKCPQDLKITEVRGILIHTQHPPPFEEERERGDKGGGQLTRPLVHGMGQVGDGNLNLVFIVLGPRDHVVVKQVREAPSA